MSVETFDIVLDWLPIDCDVVFAGFGEPFLHDKCIEFVHYLSLKGIRTSIMTNGKALDKDNFDLLFSKGLYKLQISILLNSKQDDLEYFSNIIPEKYHNSIQFNLLYTFFINDFLKISESLRKRGFKFIYKRIHGKAGSLYVPNPKSSFTCGTFFSYSYISTDGRIHLCSNDINGECLIGNVRENTFADILSLKESFLGTQPPFPVCNDCDDEYRYLHFKKLINE
jgi:MoaA/NifB/PqqE/SkfB family radical SAM enzyme